MKTLVFTIALLFTFGALSEIKIKKYGSQIYGSNSIEREECFKARDILNSYGFNIKGFKKKTQRRIPSRFNDTTHCGRTKNNKFFVVVRTNPFSFFANEQSMVDYPTGDGWCFHPNGSFFRTKYKDCL